MEQKFENRLGIIEKDMKEITKVLHAMQQLLDDISKLQNILNERINLVEDKIGF